MIKASELNLGLAKSVRNGVGQVLEEYGRAIVLEDDLKLGKYFLRYMNDALIKYENVQTVAQISGFQFPFLNTSRPSAFFSPATNTIGWATWQDRWKRIDFAATGWEAMKTNRRLRSAFNLDNAYNFYRILKRQMESSTNDSWAIFYWWYVFNSSSLVLYPGYPLVQHDDFGSAGVHKSDFSFYDQPNWDPNYCVQTLPDIIQINDQMFSLHAEYLRSQKQSVLHKIMHRFRAMMNS